MKNTVRALAVACLLLVVVAVVLSSVGSSLASASPIAHTIEMEVRLQMTRSEFNDERQADFKAAVAATAGTSEGSVAITRVREVASRRRGRLLSNVDDRVVFTDIVDSSGPRRLLLTASIDVEFRAEGAQQASIDFATLSTELTKRSLPAATATTTASTTTSADTPCPKGSYVESRGTCILCDVGQYSDLADSVVCTSCGIGAMSAVGSTAVENCTCPAGYTGDASGGWGCSACSEGSYKDAAGSVLCTSCGIGATSAVASTAVGHCTCPAGYTGDASGGGSCTACGVGRFKDVAGSAACTSCGSNATSVVGSIRVGSCICPAGFTGDASEGGRCTVCPAGSFKDVAGSVACTRCGRNATSVVGSTAVGSCICSAGYTGDASDGGGCTACSAGSYKDASGSATCTDCSVGYTSAVGSMAVSNCAFSACPVGYTGDEASACATCIEGSYKDAAGSATCTSCGSGATSALGSTAVSECICPVGYTVSGGSCQPCPAGSYTDAVGSVACTSCGGAATSGAGSTAFSDCIYVLSLGSSFSCGQNATTSLKCWGSNQYGHLGIGTHASDHYTPVVNRVRRMLLSECLHAGASAQRSSG